ncbi:hypothetical protein CsSME_00013620 [Camellia sinensis var. sinensis]
MVGDDDPKVHDEKESDGGGAGSLASQDHHNHNHPFTEGDEEEMKNREDTLTVRSTITESEPVVGISGNGKSTPNVAMDANSVEVRRAAKARLPPAGEAELLVS